MSDLFCFGWRLCNTTTNNNTPCECSACWREGGTTRCWYRGLTPSTGHCSALTLDWPPGLSSLLIHTLFLPHWPALCVSWWCSTGKLKVLSIQRWSYVECEEQGVAPLWAAHGSKYMLICSKDWLEVFLSLDAVYISEKNHEESINNICTYCFKDNTTVCEMQVLCVWHQDKVEPTALIQYFWQAFATNAKSFKSIWEIRFCFLVFGATTEDYSPQSDDYFLDLSLKCQNMVNAHCNGLQLKMINFILFYSKSCTKPKPLVFYHIGQWNKSKPLI